MKHLFYILFIFVLSAALQAQEVTITQSGGTTVVTDSLDDLPAAAAFKAADRVVLTDSTGTWQKLVNQARDSTIFSAASYADIVKISTTLKVGDRIKVKDTGDEYYVQADSIRYYTVDDSLVIDLGGKYAIIDYSKKRSFETISEFLAIAPLCRFTGETEKLYFGKDRHEILVSASPIVVNQLNVAKDTVVDNEYLVKFNTAFAGTNEIYNSQHTVGYASSLGSVFSPTASFDSGQPGRDGSRKASRAVSNGTVFYYPQSGTTFTTGTVTLSCYAWSKKGTGTIRVSGGGPVTTVTTTPKRYSHTFTNASTGSAQITFTTTGADTIYFQDVQFESGGTLTPYKETINRIMSGTAMYLNIGYSLLENKVLRLDKINGFSKDVFYEKGEHTNFLNNAITYCDKGRRANIIQLDGGTYQITNTINLKDNVRIRGVGLQNFAWNNNTWNRGTTIYISTPSTVPAFKFYPDGSEQTIGNSGLENLNLILADTIRSIIDCKEMQGSIFRNISASAATNMYVDTAFIVRVAPSSDSYGNIYENVRMNGNDKGKVGLFYEGSVDNDFKNIGFDRFEKGVVLKGGAGVTIDGLYAQTCNQSLHVYGGSPWIKDIYTEDSGKNGKAAIQIDDGTVTFEKGIFQAATGSDTLFVITGGKVKFSGSDFRGSSSLSRISDNAIIKFDNVASLFPLHQLSKGVLKDNITSDFNTQYGGTTIYRNLNTNTDNVLSRGNEINLLKPTLTDTIIFSGNKLFNLSQNLLANSDSLGVAASRGTPDTIKQLDNVVVAPDGTTTAELLTYQGNNIGAGSVGWFSRDMLDVFNVGDDFTVSFWVKTFFNGDGWKVTCRPYNDGANDVTLHVYGDSLNWQLVHVNGKIKSKTGGNIIVFRLQQPSGEILNDSIAVWRAGLFKGKWPLSPVKTTTTGVNTYSEIADITSSGIQFVTDVTVPAEVFGPLWNGSNEVPTKNDVYDELVKDTVYISLAPLGLTDSLKTVAELASDYFTIPAELNGYKIAKIQYGAYQAGAGAGTTTVGLRRYDSSRSIGYSGGYAVAFAAGEYNKTATSTSTVVTGDLYVFQVTAHSMVTAATGLTATLMLTK